MKMIGLSSRVGRTIARNGVHSESMRTKRMYASALACVKRVVLWRLSLGGPLSANFRSRNCRSLDYPEVAHPMPGRAARIRGYNVGVRHYTTEPMNGGITFRGVSCEHRVSTLDFSVANGNRRTQGGKAMNNNPAETHSAAPRPPAPAYVDGRNRY